MSIRWGTGEPYMRLVPYCMLYTIKRGKLVLWLYIHCSPGYNYLHLFYTYIFLQYTALLQIYAVYWSVSKNGVQETYNNIMVRWSEGFHRFRVRLDHPCSRGRFPCVYTIHYTAIRRRHRHVEGTGREDCVVVYKYACAVTMVAVHAAAAAPGFGYNFENRSKR